jgi:hypothetical protein
MLSSPTRTYLSDIERSARNPMIVVVQKLVVALGLYTGQLLD